MGTVSEASLVKPIVGILAASRELLAEARAALDGSFAAIEDASSEVEWKVSTYYQREMGAEIWRQYVSLVGLVRPDELVRMKLKTNDLEERWRAAQGRQVNLDPGYVGYTKLVLASTKDASHRVYLGQGIYAEATLQFVRGSFQPWPYTYRDYAEPAAIEFFNRVRERYREEYGADRRR